MDVCVLFFLSSTTTNVAKTFIFREQKQKKLCMRCSALNKRPKLFMHTMHHHVNRSWKMKMHYRSNVAEERSRMKQTKKTLHSKEAMNGVIQFCKSAWVVSCVGIVAFFFHGKFYFRNRRMGAFLYFCGINFSALQEWKASPGVDVVGRAGQKLLSEP